VLVPFARTLLLAPALALAALASAPSAARAQEQAPDNELPGPRIALVPGIGFGMAGFTGGTGALPGFVATSVVQGEAIVEFPRLGFFLRGAYLTSGQAGRWTAPEFAAGAQYRLLGDGEVAWGLVARTGVLFARWSGNTGGCDILWFIPQSCPDYSPPTTEGQAPPAPSAPSFVINTNTLGLLAALKLEAPVRPVYLALSAELGALADVDRSSPGSALTAQLTLTFGFRSHSRVESSVRHYEPRGPHPYQRPIAPP
jgi:hypothetical protein